MIEYTELILSLFDLAGHLFYMCLLLGTWLLADRNELGWIPRILGSAGWAVIGWHIGMTSIMFWSLIFVINDVRGWYKWKKS